jgi:PucR family transcriptional regulator, purine catabolism regulatory protein
MSASLATRGDTAPLTVETALRLPSLRRGAPQVVAGHRSLGRAIRWVHSSEVQNISQLLRGGELLLMTGMAIGKRPEAQRHFIRGLADCGIAALVIELGQVYRELPAEIVREAETRELPLVVLRREVPFVEVTEEIHSAIVSRRFSVLRVADELHAQLVALMIDGAGIPELLATLAASIANPVLLEQEGHGVLYQATYRATAVEALAAWSVDAGDQAHRFAVPVIVAHGQAWGSLVALALDSPLDDFDRAAVEHAVPLVALALLRSGQESVLRARERGNFLADVLGGRIRAEDAEVRAAALGLEPPADRLLPIAMAAATRQSPSGPSEVTWPAVWREVRDALRAAGLRSIIGMRAAENDMLMVLAVAGGMTRAMAVEAIVRATRPATDRAAGHADAVVIAAGEMVAGWDGMPRALRRALETAVLAQGAPPRAWHDATMPDLTRLLWSLRGDVRVGEFVEQRLRALLEHDRTHGARLLPTLETLCEHHWHKAEAARGLGVNRQSLYPRIERIERVLGADLDDPETRLSLELALRFHRQIERPGAHEG